MRSHLSCGAVLAAVAFLALLVSARAPPPAQGLALVRSGGRLIREGKAGRDTASVLLERDEALPPEMALEEEGTEEALLSIRELPPEGETPGTEPETPSPSPSQSWSPSPDPTPSPSMTPTPTSSPSTPTPVTPPVVTDPTPTPTTNSPTPTPTQTTASPSPTPSKEDDDDDDTGNGEEDDDDDTPAPAPGSGAGSGGGNSPSEGQDSDLGAATGGLGGGAIGAIAAAGVVVFLVIVAAVIIRIRRRAHSRSGDGSYYNFNEGAATPIAPSGSDIGPDAGTTRSGSGLGPQSDSKPSGGTGTTSGGTLGSPITTASTPMNPASQESIIPGDSVSQREAAHPGAAAKPELVPVPVGASAGSIGDRPVEPSAPTASKFTRIDSGVSSTSDDTIVAPPLATNPPQQTPSSIAPWFVEGGGE